jgi:ribulose-5-phosphate 4-epimerase/fuculose-1-phosphate aldolase
MSIPASRNSCCCRAETLSSGSRDPAPALEKTMPPAPRPAKPPMTDSEWGARCDLAALYRIVDRLGWTDLINTHMSARIPGEPDAFLINRYGETFDEITASSLVKLDLEGNQIGGGNAGINSAGFTIHSGVYKARPDANCVTHTHTRAGAGVSLLKNGLRPISQDAISILDEVAYHPYGVPATVEECEALGRTCRHGSCVVLLNHGLLAFGPTIHGALMRLYTLERACELELVARMMDEPPVAVAGDVVAQVAEQMKAVRDDEAYGLLEWQGLVRAIDRKGADYRR